MQKRMVGVIAIAMAVVGCGASDDYANDPRPPAPINVAVSVKRDAVNVSPSHVGAGPARLIVTNLTAHSRDVEVTAPAGSSRGCVEADTSSGPINPRGTAHLAVDLRQGECLIAVRGDHSTRPARLTVGRERPSAQDVLLQP